MKNRKVKIASMVVVSSLLLGGTMIASAQNTSNYTEMKNILLNDSQSGGVSSIIFFSGGYSPYQNDQTNKTISTVTKVSNGLGVTNVLTDNIKYMDKNHVYEIQSKNSSPSESYYWLNGTETDLVTDNGYATQTSYPNDLSVSTDNFGNGSSQQMKKFENVLVDTLVSDELKSMVKKNADGSVGITLSKQQIPQLIAYGYQADISANAAYVQNTASGQYINSLTVNNQPLVFSTPAPPTDFTDTQALSYFKTADIDSVEFYVNQTNGDLSSSHLSITVTGVSFDGKTVTRNYTQDVKVSDIGTTKVDETPNLNGLKVANFDKNNDFSTGTATFTYQGQSCTVTAEEAGFAKNEAYYAAIEKLFGGGSQNQTFDPKYMALITATFPDGTDIWVTK